MREIAEHMNGLGIKSPHGRAWNKNIVCDFLARARKSISDAELPK